MVLGLKRRWRESQPDSARAPEAPAEYFDTHLLALLFEQHEPGATLNVLDVGPAAGQTVEFLSQYRCHLHYADLYDEPGLLTACEPDQLPERVEQLRTVLTAPGAVRSYDICLFWDLFRCMDPTALPALGRALAELVSKETLAHAFLSHGRSQIGQGVAARCFAIVNHSRARHRPCTHRHLVPHNVSQRDVLEKLGCFETDKSRLLQGGLLEVVMQGVRGSEQQSTRQ